MVAWIHGSSNLGAMDPARVNSCRFQRFAYLITAQNALDIGTQRSSSVFVLESWKGAVFPWPDGLPDPVAAEDMPLVRGCFLLVSKTPMHQMLAAI